MSEKNDDSTKNAEPSQTPSCGSGTTITVGLDSFNVLSYDRYKYSKALEDIRESIDGLKRSPAQFDLYADFIDKHLKSVGK